MRMSTQTSRGDVLDAAISPDGRYLAYLAGRRGARQPARATGRDRERRGGAARERRRPREPRLLPGRQLRLLPDPQARQPQLPGAPPGPVARRDAAGARLRRGLAGHLLARREAGRLLAGRAPEAGSPAGRLRPRELEGAPAGHGRASRRCTRARPPGLPTARRSRRPLLKPAPDLQTTVAFFDAETGSRRDFLALPRTIFASLAWLPDGRGLVATGQDLQGALYDQVFLIGHPDARLQQVTNDFHPYAGVSVSAGEEAIAAVRQHPARQPLARRRRGRGRPAAHVDHQPGGLARRLRGGGAGDRRLHGPARPAASRSGRSARQAASRGRSPRGRCTRSTRGRPAAWSCSIARTPGGPHLAHGAGRQRPAPAHLGRRRAGRGRLPRRTLRRLRPLRLPAHGVAAVGRERRRSRLTDEASGILGFSPDSTPAPGRPSRGGRARACRERCGRPSPWPADRRRATFRLPGTASIPPGARTAGG